jgi:ABC-type amino acid transport substrate-binding protein
MGGDWNVKDTWFRRKHGHSDALPELSGGRFEERECVQLLEELYRQALQEDPLLRSFGRSNTLEIFLSQIFSSGITEELSQTLEGLKNSIEDSRKVQAGAAQMNQKIATLRKTMEQTLESEASGVGAMEDARHSMLRMGESFTQVQTLFKELAEATSQVTEMLDAISSVAKHTNLLALNAAIEAARAGEHGRGFAVVADEVRRLADESMETARKIEEVLSGITARMESSQTILGECHGAKEKATEDIALAAEKLSHSSEELQQTGTITEELSLFMNHQGEAINEVVERSEDIIEKSSHILEHSQNASDQTSRMLEASQNFDSFVRKRFDGLVNLSSRDLVQRLLTDHEELRVGHDDSFAPWVGMDPQGVSSGISIAIFQEICRNLGTSPAFFGASWIQVFPLLEKRFLRVVLNAGWPNPYFNNFPVAGSHPYAAFETLLYSAQGEEKIALEDLRGKRVGVQAGGVGNLIPLLRKRGATLVEHENDTISFAEHLWGKTDLVAAEKKVAAHLNRTVFSQKFRAVSEVLEKTDIVCLVHEEDEALLKEINRSIEELQRGGILKKIQERV